MLNFWVSGKFPETAWRHIPGRHATHGIVPSYGFSGWKAWRYWSNRQATRTCGSIFNNSVYFEVILIG